MKKQALRCLNYLSENIEKRYRDANICGVLNVEDRKLMEKFRKKMKEINKYIKTGVE
jgi:hypothetical protein